MVRKIRSAAIAVSVTAVTLVWSLGGCQALISGDVPSFRCGDDSPQACPQGLKCATTRGECVAACDEGACRAAGKKCDSTTQACTESLDATVDADGGGPTDAKDADAEPQQYTACPNGVSDCQSGQLCVTSAEHGIGTIAPLCSKTCCSTADCPENTVCYASGRGNRVCLPAALLSRKLGTKLAGETCSIGPDCRSGVCRDGRCEDTCCKHADCKSGAVCAVDALTDAGGALSWYCRPKIGTKLEGQTCFANTECNTRRCVDVGGGGSCIWPCGGDTECMTADPAARCTQFPLPSTNDIVSACLVGGADAGTACTVNTQCASNNCEGLKCRRTCGVDSHCFDAGACIISSRGVTYCEKP